MHWFTCIMLHIVWLIFDIYVVDNGNYFINDVSVEGT